MTDTERKALARTTLDKAHHTHIQIDELNYLLGELGLFSLQIETDPLKRTINELKEEA